MRLISLFLIILLLFLITIISISKKTKRKKKNNNNNNGNNNDDSINYQSINELNDKLNDRISDINVNVNSKNELLDDEKLSLLIKEKEIKSELNQIKLVYGDMSYNYAKILHKLGGNIYKQGRYDDSYHISKEIVKIHERLDGYEHISTAQAFGNLGSAAFRLGKTDECNYAMQRALFIFIQEYGIDSNEVLLHRGKMMTFQIKDGELSLGLSYSDYEDES